MAEIDDMYSYLEAAVDGKAPPVNGDKPRDSSKGRAEGEERSRKDRKHRSRSRSKDRKRSERERHSRERDRDRSDRDRDRYRKRGREPTPPEQRLLREQERLAREKERELKELERATRTVFAFNLNIKADERDIWGFFSKVGKVTDIRIIDDRRTGKSKGMAYIEFDKQECVFTALALTGQTFMGQPVMVKPAEAEKNVAWEAAQAAKANNPEGAALLQAAGIALPVPKAKPGEDGVTIVPIGPPITLRVTNFPPGLGDVELRQVFEPFGAVNDVTMVKDPATGLETICEVTFARAQDGQAAQQHWNGTELIGSKLSVSIVPSSASAPIGGAALAAASTPALPTGLVSAAAADAGGVGELDDEEGGLKLNSQARAALMSRLAGGAGVPPAVTAAAGGAAPQLTVAPGAPNVDPTLFFAQGVLGPPSPIPTQCILLKNVWRAEQTAEPGWEMEVSEDIAEEASKCGQLLHMHMDTASQGFVYLKFAAMEGATACHKLLNGRFYQGNQIVVEYQFVQPYNAHFGLA